VVADPGEDDRDADEWYTFFSQFGEVASISVALDNADLLHALADARIHKMAAALHKGVGFEEDDEPKPETSRGNSKKGAHANVPKRGKKVPKAEAGAGGKSHRLLLEEKWLRQECSTSTKPLDQIVAKGSAVLLGLAHVADNEAERAQHAIEQDEAHVSAACHEIYPVSRIFCIFGECPLPPIRIAVRLCFHRRNYCLSCPEPQQRASADSGIA
jgi:hypothetical protein